MILRAAVFNFLFYLITVFLVVLGSPLLLAPRWLAMTLIYKGQARLSLWLLRHVVGIKMEVRGHENLLEGPVLIASKHQSAWDTFALITLFKDPVMVMKRELFLIPFLGWFSLKYKLIGVRRSKGPAALRQLLKDARLRAKEGREIVIFPEGSRKAPGAPPAYKSGIFLLYKELNLPVVPVALNSGLFWPRRKFIRFPGTIVVEFLPPIQPGLAREAFMSKVQESIERTTDALIREGRESKINQS